MMLPYDILLEIFGHIVKPQHLASLCLVNNSFQTAAVCKLYDRVFIYDFHIEGRSKAMKLFYTLSQYPYLALLVHCLAIQAFTNYPPRYVASGLKNCTNLRSFTWTRHGSLNSNILKALHHCKNLRELEFTGYIDRKYDLQLLLGFAKLHRISLIMPSESIVCQLKPWLSATGATMRSLTLICEVPSILTDGILKAIAPSLVNLEYLNLSGCPKVTHHGVWAIVSSSKNGICGLALEGVYPNFDVAAFADLCIPSGALRRLRSFTMTTYFLMHREDFEDCMKHVVHLLSDSPLEIFQIHSCAWTHGFSVTDELWTKLLLAHGKRLLRISVHRAVISREAVHSICVQCTKLEQLFLFVQPNFLDELASILSFAKALRTIHIKINKPGPVVLPQSQLLSLLNKCSPTVTQFGCDAEVWQVSRAIEVNEDGSINSHRTLVPYESPGIPEKFLVVQPIGDTRMLLHQLSVA